MFETKNYFSRELINCGLLLIRNQDSYWISFPSSGNFIRRYVEGRKYLIQLIKRRKFQEILENVSCSLRKNAFLLKFI